MVIVYLDSILITLIGTFHTDISTPDIRTFHTDTLHGLVHVEPPSPQPAREVGSPYPAKNLQPGSPAQYQPADTPEL